MSDQEYDSTDSSIALEGEGSGAVGREAVGSEGEQSPLSPPIETDESSGEENEVDEEEDAKGSDNELTESEKPERDGSEVKEEVGGEEDEGSEGGSDGEGESDREGIELESSDEEVENSFENTEESSAVPPEKSTKGKALL